MEKQLEIFLLIGQSNMAGRGKIIEFSPVKNIYSFSENNSLIKAKHPLHYDKKEIAGVGPGLKFAEEVYSKSLSKKKILLIPCSMGGSKISEWGEKEKLYQSSLNKVKLASNFGDLKGILWMQGESDADDKIASFSYDNSLINLIKNYRRDLNNEKIPFFICEIPDFLILEDYPYVKIVNDNIEKAKSKLSNVFLIKNNNWKHLGDFLHLGTETSNYVGKEMARKYLKYCRTFEGL